ncbi:MAG: manganese oxidase [Thermoleophilaceae bacterium]|jgi:plastocyanin|nr:manganese oxidase [Thermoleophilaceae bacterium]
MSKLGRALLCTVIACGVVAGVAYADATIYAGPPNQFFQGDVTIAQGEAITFTNGDTVTHDVTSSTKGADGKPLFASEQIGPGQSSPVAGVEFLTTGSYPYICSIHPFMKGTITVSSDGTPKPRPGGGDAGGGDKPAPAADTTAPTLSVKVLDTKRSQVRKRRSLQVALTSDEAGAFTLIAKSGKTVVASGSSKFTKAATRKVTLELTKAGLAAAKKSKAVAISLEVSGKDAAGNATSASASGKLR